MRYSKIDHPLEYQLMKEQDQHQLMLKIIIGSAWADGHLEPTEEQYLQTLLKRYQLTDVPELKTLLDKPVALAQTERWMVQYLADANETQRQSLLAAIGKMVIADDTVTQQEHRFLDDYYLLMAKVPPIPEQTPKLVKTVGQFVRQVVKKLR